MENIWRTYGVHMEDILRTYGGHMEKIWRTYGGYMEDIWRTYGGHMEDIWDHKENILTLFSLVTIFARLQNPCSESNQVVCQLRFDHVPNMFTAILQFSLDLNCA